MTTDNFCFHLQNRLIQTGQTGGQMYSDTPPLAFPGKGLTYDRQNVLIVRATDLRISQRPTCFRCFMVGAYSTPI
jgi:hypothetical protein